MWRLQIRSESRSSVYLACLLKIHPLRFCPCRGDMHRTVRINLNSLKELTRVGALPRIGVTGVVKLLPIACVAAFSSSHDAVFNPLTKRCFSIAHFSCLAFYLNLFSCDALTNQCHRNFLAKTSPKFWCEAYRPSHYDANHYPSFSFLQMIILLWQVELLPISR